MHPVEDDTHIPRVAVGLFIKHRLKIDGFFQYPRQSPIFKYHKHCADFNSYNEDMQRIYTNLLAKWNASEDKVKKLQEEVEQLKTQLNSRNEFQCSTKLLSSSPYLVAQSN